MRNSNNGLFKIAACLPGTAKGSLNEMGMKAYDLGRMARIGLPVPPAFVLGTRHCCRWYRDQERFRKGLAGLLEEQISWLQNITGLRFGDARRPLLVSVRSGAPVSMPGMMDTLLNIGLCDATVHGFLRITGNPRLVWDSYCRLIRSFAEVVHGATRQPFETELEAMLAKEGVNSFQELDYLSLNRLAQTWQKIFIDLIGQPFPQNPLQQLELAVQTVFASWNSARAIDYRRLRCIADDLFSAATVQQMVFGNAGGASGGGVGFTRDPDSGVKRLYFDFLFNSQGEDVVAGRAIVSDSARLFAALPEIHPELLYVCKELEKEFRDAQEFEFTIQDGVLYLLQSRAAKRTEWAALRIAVEQVQEGLIDSDEALARLDTIALDGIVRQRLALEHKQPLCQGQPAGIGVVVGALAFDLEAARRIFSVEGRSVVLIRDEMSTDDIAGIAISAGILTVRGNRTSHAAVVARQLGKPCVCDCIGLSIDLPRRAARFGDLCLSEGEIVTLDSNTGCVYQGEVEIVVEQPSEWLDQIRKWSRPAK